MEYTIVKCSHEAIDDVFWISRKTFKDAFEAQNKPEDFNHYLDTALSREALLAELKNSHTFFYFVYYKKELAGYFKLNEAESQTDLYDSSALELERIYVLSNYQGKGLGRIMIGEVIELAKERKKEFIWLGVWEENKKAIEFYKSMGFEKFGEHPYYIGQDKQNDWLMKLELPTL